LSIDQGILFKGLNAKVCIYEPYCSEYTHQAIHKYGILKGGLMGVKRILRCNPFAKGGYDPVK